MAFSVPNAINFSDPLNAVPLDWLSEPVEGAKGVQVNLPWGTKGGPNACVYINLQNNATLNFTKIRALVVNNASSGADVTFTFPDTETTVVVPAYTPYIVIPVFTNQTQFYVSASGVEPEDITNFIILNTLPPPVAVGTTQEQNNIAQSGINVSANGTMQLVPVTVSGTLEAIASTGYVFGAAGNSSTITLRLQDGTGVILWTGAMSAAATLFADLALSNLTDLRMRFQTGISLIWVTAGPPPANSCFAAMNLYYRTP